MEPLQRKQRNILEETLVGMKARQTKRTRDKSRDIFYDAMVEYLEAPGKARERGEPVGWCQVQAPVELFRAFDTPPFYPEHFSIVVASQGKEIPFLEAAEIHHLKDVCSVEKIFIGAAMAGALAKPDFMIGCTHPCDAVLFGMQHVAFPHTHKGCTCKKSGCVNGVPIFQLDGPFWTDEHSIDYYAGEVEEAIAFMEKQLGKKLDYDRLKQVVANTCELFRIHAENNQLRKVIPSPMQSRNLARQAFVLNNLSGSEIGVEYMRALNEELKKNVAEGKGGIPNERIRLGWLNAQPYSFMPFLDEMEREFGAVVVTDNLSCGWLGGDGSDGPLFYCNPEDPIKSLAAKGLSHYGSNCYKDANRFSQVVIRMVKNYKLDGVIFSAHWGCKNICAIIKHLREECYEATGVTMLVLESDCLDQRTNPIPQMMNRTREYIEMLNQRKV
jgi:benzoyl-CoA reductase/2-hydroxyglutaryl-CoA dehydratase subunit BcrC/BadD/HgdB